MAFSLDPDELQFSNLSLSDSSRRSSRHFLDHERSSDICTEPQSVGVELVQCCTLCEKLGKQKARAVAFCLEDKEQLCTECCTGHSMIQATKDHHLQALHPTQNPRRLDANSNRVENTAVLARRQGNKSFTPYPVITCQDQFAPPEIPIPGKPIATNMKADSVELTWSVRHCDVDCFQIRYKPTSGEEKYSIYNTRNNTNSTTISGLRGSTNYKFQVRCILNEEEGRYGPLSDELKTLESLASRLLPKTTKQNKNMPSVYLLHPKENKNCRDKERKIKSVYLGKANRANVNEKTIMLVGSTGSGKSTLVDGIINYFTGVNFVDSFRFTLVQLEEEEKKQQNQAISQTEWITVYKVFPSPGSRLDFTLNIIDTPGFGDTRGIQRDREITNQIKHLFSVNDGEGVMFLDAVCFIVKAPDARLTQTQSYIFDSIMSLFGQDVESNICTLITFADGQKPPVLAALQEANVPFGKWFPFNNSGLFADNTDHSLQLGMTKMFWDMGYKSFERFFHHLCSLSSKSITQTKAVLEQRHRLQTVVENLHPQIQGGLSKIHEMKDELRVLKSHISEIKKNENFTYKVTEVKIVKQDIPDDWFVTNCSNCNTTCHKHCRYRDDSHKKFCSAMDPYNGRCKVCMQKCDWFMHKNAGYIITYIEEVVERTYKEKKQKYEAALGKTFNHEAFLKSLTADITVLFEKTDGQIQEMNKCKNILKNIALRPDPLSMVDYIDLMIESEKMSRQVGFLERISVLQLYKEYAESESRYEFLEKAFMETQRNMKALMEEKKKQGILSKIFEFFR